mgnify:CR=1 FL=1
MTPKDINNLCWYAARYAMGRMTYAVADVTEAIDRNRADLSPATRDGICADIDRAAQRGELGMAQDVERWLALRATLTPKP